MSLSAPEPDAGPVDARAEYARYLWDVFSKLLVANRGEIACRVLRTAERLGIQTVAVFSDADTRSPHLELADESVRLGPPPVRDSYLNIDSLVAAIELTGADAVHPGYGLLSENAEFARRVSAAGACFVGPRPETLELLGDKIRARALAREAGLEPPPGTDAPVDPSDSKQLHAAASAVGYPVLVKAAAGGGGIGMQIVQEPSGLERAVQTCTNRSQSAFGDGRVYLERYLDRPRHIEVQILCDAHGNRYALGERDCSVQRRHQKIIEESPSPAPFFSGAQGDARREEVFALALTLAERAGYTNAGTVELVADASGRLYFLEVNARLQVEHPVTELCTGLDLVELQLRVAAGEEIDLEPKRSGHAIEARLYAEDPSRGFMPQPGRVVRFELSDPSVRMDAGIREGMEVTPHYDPLLAKIIAHAATRAEALQALDRALASLAIELEGPKGARATNRDFLRQVLASQPFVDGDYDTSLAEAIAKKN